MNLPRRDCILFYEAGELFGFYVFRRTCGVPILCTDEEEYVDIDDGRVALRAAWAASNRLKLPLERRRLGTLKMELAV